MTVEDMIIGVNLGVQKVDSAAYDNLLDGEVLYYLNKANREYIRRQNVFLKENLKNSSREDFISSSEAGYNLGALLSITLFDSEDISVSSHYSNAKSVSISDITDDVFSLVSGQVKPSEESGWISCKEISPSEIHQYSKTESNDAIFRRYPYVVIGNNITIFYASGGDIYNFSLMYIKSPSKLVIADAGEGEVTSPELPTHTHDDIVDIAISMILEDIKSARPYEQNQTTIKGE